jgi:hypothetical protein
MGRELPESLPVVWQKFKEKGLVVPPFLVPIPSDVDRFARFSQLSGFLMQHYQSYLTMTPIRFFHNGKEEWRHWVVGPYSNLTLLAQHLRREAKELAPRKNEQASKVHNQDWSLACFGRRDTDRPPTGSHPDGGFRKDLEKKRKAGLVPDHPTNPKLVEIRQIDPNTNVRRTDRKVYEKFEEFYSKKTLEAHHIVEKSILGTLKLNKGQLEDPLAPCVLVVSELHQQMYTREVRKKRDLFHFGMSSDKQTETLTEIYEGTKVEKGLYDTHHMGDLLEIAKIIIKEAKDYAEHIKHRR